ncbi:Gfo/Idh/MocA family protein [Lignipirellula cremea]|uniref:Oxidoreductase YteT n=1 Tax=Lignipirellula cremea TaxID=2528010 RepID=A0A518E1N0_9BACT|nr:Gfo/Idh/MocA family oxidoreductase [Lignipirellula cremea]QDU98005.1 Putative oxidoreductase YteT precursor [Lignipirellula cremea]
MPAKYRVAVIGHTGRGNWGHGLDTFWRMMPECEVAAVADADPAGLAKAADRLHTKKAYADWRKMLDEVKPHVISICPRHPDQHAEMAIGAAQRGIHVFLEKPFCQNLEQADQIVAAFEKNNVKLALAHQTRYSPRVQAVRDLIMDDKLGTILELRGRGKEDHRGGGEDLWVLGSHVLNLMNVFGGEAHSCFGRVLQNGHRVTAADVAPGNDGLGPLAGDAVHAMYAMDDGVTGYFSSVKNMTGKPWRFGLQIFGSKGVVEIVTGYLPEVSFLPDSSWSPGRTASKWLPVTSAGVNKPETYEDGGHEAGNVAAVRDLLSAIEEDRQPECSMYEGRHTIEMIAGVFESHRQNAPVKLPLENRKNPLTML